MTEDKKIENQHGEKGFIHKLDRSAIWTVIGIIFLFSFSIIVVLIAPRYVDSTWTSPSTPYQVQMYEVSDPNYYMSNASTGGAELQYVHHLKQDYTLLAFKEMGNLRFVAPPELEQYITKEEDEELKLTSRLLLLRAPEGNMVARADDLQKKLQGENALPSSDQSPEVSKKENKESKKLGRRAKEKEKNIQYEIFELYDPHLEEAFSFDPSGGILQNWIDKQFRILDGSPKQSYHSDYGVSYVENPQEFRIKKIKYGEEKRWRYDPAGSPVEGLAELTNPLLGFYSRKDLISIGEEIYAIEGCWYCHTDQTRTLIEDVVLNGSDSYPAPPSSANEFIYQKITFPGTRRIGPDLSRVGVKRPSRDWHKAHFWAPKTASEGSIMPAFQHFFDNDPRGTGKSITGIPNYRFEAIYQYMMTKGTRITPPTQAWWLGKDPIDTKEIIEGKRKLP